MALQHIVSIASFVSYSLNRCVEYLVMGVSLSMALVILLQVVFRYVFNHSLFWSEELGRMLLVWLSFMGASVAYKRKAHMGVAVFVSRLPRPLRLTAACVAHVAALLLFWTMLWYGVQFFTMLAPQMTVSLGISRQWPFLAVPLSGGVMLVHVLHFLLQDIGRLIHHEPEP